MSYCRWSSDNFKSDVYVYEDVRGGYTTHVASNRIISEVFPFDWENVHETYDKHIESLKKAIREPITLPHAGESFHSQSLEECIDTLEYLVSLGYNVPQRALDALKQELKEQNETV